MSQIPLVYAGYDYWDRSRPLIDGRVSPEGVDLNYIVMPPVQTPLSPQLDAVEASLCSYMVMRAHGDDSFVGIPIFPSRRFVHSYIFVRSDAGIEAPRDLAGKRVGIPHYQSTPIVWMRAVLQHDYGVSLSSIHWFQGTVDAAAAAIAPRGPSRPDVNLPATMQLTVVPGPSMLDDMLMEGEIDALMAVHRPVSFLSGHPRVRRLFPNYLELEREYYLRTGILPNMHVLLLRKEVYEQHRWLPHSLLRAFEAAKALTRQRMGETGNAAVSFPWLLAYLEETTHVFGEDSFPYGVKANIRSLEAMAEYLVEQGLASRTLKPEELFAEETLSL